MTEPGHLLADRYRLREQIGGGGMGAVWLARDERLTRDVAIKQVLPPAGTDPAVAAQQRERALREGRIAARLSHPHAIAVYDVAVEDDQPWLVMEYLPSRSLAAVLVEDGVLRVDQAAQIGAQIADALVATHAAGIVHRDVKPANVLIGRGGRIEGLVKITDFGISHASGDVMLTQTGQITGTPAYLPPEVAQGMEPGPAADVFSLGATLYACLEGQPPFGVGDNALQQLHRAAGGAIEPPLRSGELTRPLLRMLAIDPAMRPDMTEVRDELASLAAGRDGDTTMVLAAPMDITPLGGDVGEAPTTELPAAPTLAAPVADRVEQPPGGPEPAVPVHALASVPSARPSGPRRHSNRLLGRAAAAAAGVAAVVGLAALWSLQDRDPGTERAATTSTAPPSSPTTTATIPADSGAAATDGGGDEASAATTAPATTAPATTTPAQAAGAGEEASGGTSVGQYLTDYHEAVLEDPASAYGRAGPTLRSSITLAGFEAFWDRFTDVSIRDVEVGEGGDSAVAVVELRFPDGSRQVERHQYDFVVQDGQPALDRDTFLEVVESRG